MKITDIIDLLLEVDQLEAFPRSGYLKRGISRPESVAAHIYGTTFLAMILADLIEGANAEKVMRLALLHELGEVHITDIPRIATDYFTVEVKEDAERRAAVDLLKPLNNLGDYYLKIFDEFIAGETLEARIVRAADKMQMMLKVFRYEMAGNRLVAEFWNYLPNFANTNLPFVSEFYQELKSRRHSN